MSNIIKKKAARFAREHKLKKLSFEGLKCAAEKIGYTVVEFNGCYNDENVDIIISNLNLQKEIIISRGFTYTDKNYRIIFVNEDLTEEEKVLILSHELGHIECGHLSFQNVIGKDVKEEYEANEFSHYLLKESVVGKAGTVLCEHKKTFVTVAIMLFAALILSVTVFSVKNEKKYYGEYYITAFGEKYHKKDCIYIKNKKTTERLTNEMFETGKYSACNICLQK